MNIGGFFNGWFIIIGLLDMIGGVGWSEVGIKGCFLGKYGGWYGFIVGGVGI